MTSIATESTGVYWIPVYEILEQRGSEVILVNARHAKNVPGVIRVIVAGERNPDVLATYRDVRCHSSIATIRAALVGNDWHENVFA
ncbi:MULTISPECIES: hypothetical protein [unclassified Bradyrhizobium]|uniref:hypothetical protein n=1 Tax=unclassified Bradyrhizobium TaxID=2631580 RepID=UPI001CD269AE|nr:MULTISPECIES: hypothetical protein [unclassified Bradyrhizobium]